MQRFIWRSLAGGIIIGMTVSLASCGGGSPGSLGNGVVPQSQSTVQPTTRDAASQTKSSSLNPSAPNPCLVQPLRGLLVTPTTITIAPGAQSSFQICTQFNSTYALTASNSLLASPHFPETVTPKPMGQNDVFIATVNITAGAVGGADTLTIKDKKGDKQTVTVNITVGPLSFSCPALANADGTTVACTVTNPGYGGTYTFTASSTSNNCTPTLSGFTVSDTTAEGCTLTLKPTTGSEAQQQQTVQFDGPLSLSCPGPGVVNGTGIICTITNPNYPAAGTYTVSRTSGSCSNGTLSGNSFSVTDTTAETTCTMQVAANSGSETAASQTMTFVGPLSFVCSSPAGVGPTGSSCTFSDPGYSGNYIYSKTGSCLPSAAGDGTLTLTDGSAEECDATITESSNPGQASTAKIQFIGPFTFGCDSAAATGSNATCNYSYPGFGGTLAASVDQTTCSATAPASGSFTVTDSVAETCTATLTPSSGPFSAQSAPITFSTVSGGVGPLSLNCPLNGTVKVVTSCSISNPGYAGAYTYGTSSATCTLSNETTSGVGVLDSAPETCTVTVTPTSGTESAVSKNILWINPGGGGGGGGGCSKPRIVHGKKNGKPTGFAVQC